MVERLNGIEEVRGSNPLGSIFLACEERREHRVEQDNEQVEAYRPIGGEGEATACPAEMEEDQCQHAEVDHSPRRREGTGVGNEARPAKAIAISDKAENGLPYSAYFGGVRVLPRSARRKMASDVLAGAAEYSISE